MTKSTLLSALTSSALLSLSPMAAHAETLEPAASGFAEAAAVCPYSHAVRGNIEVRLAVTTEA
jgi:organic hydroperoxide reductase OsmC/OhrA